MEETEALLASNDVLSCLMDACHSLTTHHMERATNIRLLAQRKLIVSSSNVALLFDAYQRFYIYGLGG